MLGSDKAFYYWLVILLYTQIVVVSVVPAEQRHAKPWYHWLVIDVALSLFFMGLLSGFIDAI
ncbi:MAG: hypothetical protein QME63_08530 [Actinomycetota bacterium]|nr:hypothetical protein [Actinomycetota bacterium]